LKYTPDTVKRITEALEAGATKAYAAHCGGINADTFYAWAKEKPDFSDTIKKAQAIYIAGRLDALRKHGEKNWQAIAWELERRWPDLFARRDRVDVTANVKSENTTITIDANRTIEDIVAEADRRRGILERNGFGEPPGRN